MRFMKQPPRGEGLDVTVNARGTALAGLLVAPEDAIATIVFAHDSGSDRLNARDHAVAKALNARGLATLQFDLLTVKEAERHHVSWGLHFDTVLQSERLIGAIDWLATREELASLPVGIFGASTGAGVALRAAAARPHRVGAVVCRGGRPELAGGALPEVEAPTLFIVGGGDARVLALNRQSAAQLHCKHHIEIVAGATQLFEEAGKLDKVAMLAGDWFLRHLGPQPHRVAASGMGR